MTTTLALVAIVTLAVTGATLGLRHLFLRLDRPGGFDCSVRVVDGPVRGLAQFRAGYAGPEPGALRWRRIAWPSGALVIPYSRIDMTRGRRPAPGERRAVPARFTVVPATLADGSHIELALAPRRRAQLLELLAASAEGRSPRTGLRGRRRPRSTDPPHQ